jgi:hypothetical protein
MLPPGKAAVTSRCPAGLVGRHPAALDERRPEMPPITRPGQGLRKRDHKREQLAE